jgi:hypothetical protein
MDGAVWKQIPVGPMNLVVTPVDANGKDLPGPMRMNILKGTGGVLETDAKPAVHPLDRITMVKRPSFHGPYAKVQPDWKKLALGVSRWHFERPDAPDHRAQWATNATSVHGESGAAHQMAASIWATLALRDLTTDSRERLLSEHTLRFLLEAVETHQAVVRPKGMFYAYKGYTPLSRFTAEAVIDAWLTTREPRWKESALAYGRSLGPRQKDDGSFLCVGFDFGPNGSMEKWKQYYLWGTSELLYALGRLRRDLQTDEFLPIEKKALQWMKEVGVPKRLFPLYVHHSQSLNFPGRQHSMSALFFVRYLLECAPPEWRDVKLAEEVARWAEDYGVDWTRKKPGDKSMHRITPIIFARDRVSNEAASNNLLAAIAFHHLAKATGDKLWEAKSQALAGAVFQAIDPQSGYLSTGLIPTNDLASQQTPCAAWTVQLMLEYSAVLDGMR